MKPNIFLTALTWLLMASMPLSASAEYEPEPPSEERLMQLLAPVALYPDTVLTHVLIAATYPLEVVQAERWADKHNHLQGQEAVNAAQDQPWDPSVIALVAFPDLLSRMSEDLLWTQELGEAFLADEKATLEAVQTLRQQAADNGSLDDMEHQKVVYRDREIIIEPARREVVYVPYYDSRVVYGSWRWSAYPPVYWSSPPRYTGGFYWGYYAPVGDWFYFGGFHWSQRTIVISHNRPYYNYHHTRYGYHRHVEPWHHNPRHRRNVRYYNDNVPERWRQGQVHHDRRYSERQREQINRQLRHHRSRLEALNLNGNQRLRTSRDDNRLRTGSASTRVQRGSTPNHRLRASGSENSQSNRPNRISIGSDRATGVTRESNSISRQTPSVSRDSRRSMLDRSTSGRRFSGDRGTSTRASRLRQ